MESENHSLMGHWLFLYKEVRVLKKLLIGISDRAFEKAFGISSEGATTIKPGI